MKGVSEAIVTILLLSVTLGLAGTFYTFINGVYNAKIAYVEIIDAYCTNHTAYFVIRNGYTQPLSKSSFSCDAANSGCSGPCAVDESFPAGGAGYVKVYNCGSGTHTLKLTGVANALELIVYCQ